jgi:hypothetical protein
LSDKRINGISLTRKTLCVDTGSARNQSFATSASANSTVPSDSCPADAALKAIGGATFRIAGSCRAAQSNVRAPALDPFQASDHHN